MCRRALFEESSCLADRNMAFQTMDGMQNIDNSRLFHDPGTEQTVMAVVHGSFVANVKIAG